MTVEIALFDLPAADDFSALAEILDRTDVARIRRLALLARVPGEYEDGSRDRARAALRALLEARRLAERTHYVTVVGSEGATTPGGIAMISLKGADEPGGEPRLAMGMARAEPPDDTDLDGPAMVRSVASLVEQAIADAGLAPSEVHLAIVNAPQPSTGNIGLRGRRTRAMAALGAGIALGELTAEAADGGRALADLDLFTPRVQTFAGPAITHVEVTVIGNRPGAGGSYVACNTTTPDLLDMRPLKRMLRETGLSLDADGELETSRLAAVIAKFGVRPDGLVAGAPTTIFSSVTPPEKHGRAAMSGALGAVLHTTRIFGTFDPIHQAPNGGGTVCCIVRVQKP